MRRTITALAAILLTVGVFATPAHAFTGFRTEDEMSGHAGTCTGFQLDAQNNFYSTTTDLSVKAWTDSGTCPFAEIDVVFTNCDGSTSDSGWFGIFNLGSEFSAATLNWGTRKPCGATGTPPHPRVAHVNVNFAGNNGSSLLWDPPGASTGDHQSAGQYITLFYGGSCSVPSGGNASCTEFRIGI